MEVQIMATVGVCSEYLKDTHAKKADVSVVIAPIKVLSAGDEGKIQVINGCNLWRSCHNPDCWYSLTAREKEKA